LRRADDSPAVTLPIVVVQDKVLFKASINGRVPVDMVLDTGADHLVVSAETAGRAGLRRTAGGAGRGPQMGLVDTLDIAGLTVRRVPALIRQEPLVVLANRGGEACSPLSLGLSMIVDYARRELTLGQRLPFERADVELPLHVAGLPVITGSHAGRAVSFVIDTGADVSAVSNVTFAEAQPAPSSRRIPMRLFDAWGNRQPDAFLITPGLDLAFGALQLPAYPVVVRSWPDVEAVHGFEMGGILGHNFLRAYRVTIDLSRRVVRFRRT
jgi:predicted aspartyl protease